MNRTKTRLTSWTLASIFLLCGASYLAGCSGSGEPSGPGGNGSGGASSGGASSGGASSGGASSGGDNMGGANSGGSDNGTGGFACDPSLVGTGGSASLDLCAHPDTFPQEITCEGGEGEGGAGSYEPALARLCKASAKVEFGSVYPIYQCLAEADEDHCTEGHEAAVKDCVSMAAPCIADMEALGCAEMMDECPTLSAGVCFWGMSSSNLFDGNRPEQIQNCFADEREGESCDGRFLRCAWGL